MFGRISSVGFELSGMSFRTHLRSTLSPFFFLAAGGTSESSTVSWNVAAVDADDGGDVFAA